MAPTSALESEVGLAGVDRVRASRAVEEQQALAVVDLVLERPGLEGVRGQLDVVAGAGQLTAYDEPGRPLHVTGEVGDAHAALARLLVARGLQHLGIAEHEGAVVVARLRVRRDVDT